MCQSNKYICITAKKFYEDIQGIEAELNGRDCVKSHRDTKEKVKQKEQNAATKCEQIKDAKAVYNDFTYSPHHTKNLVHPDMSGFIHTRVFSNNFDISYRYISCAIESEDMNKIFDDAGVTKRKPEQQGPQGQPHADTSASSA